MTRKERILRMVQRQEDDVTYDKVMYHLDVMKGIEIGTEQMERGEVIPHEEVFAKLLGEHAKDPDSLDESRKRLSSKNSGGHRARRSTNGGTVRKPAQNRGRKAKKPA